MNTKAIRAYKTNLALTSRQREILIGMLLGDGHLEAQGESCTARLKVEHSASQAEYVQWKFHEFEAWTRTPPRLRQKRNRLGTCSMNICFSTLSHRELNVYRNLFYKGRRKIVPNDLVLTPLSTAVWFMDDGSRKSRECRGLYLNTQSYRPEEVELLQKILYRDLGVGSSLRLQTDGLQIYVPSGEVFGFAGAVDSHMIPAMRYKITGLTDVPKL